MGLHLHQDDSLKCLSLFANLRAQGHFCMGHIDDSFLMGYSYASCEENIVRTVHPTKSVLVPTQSLSFLVFF